jgi:hypothetical protein
MKLEPPSEHRKLWNENQDIASTNYTFLQHAALDKINFFTHKKKSTKQQYNRNLLTHYTKHYASVFVFFPLHSNDNF